MVGQVSQAARRRLEGGEAELYIVDYDIPVDLRKRFYRHLRAAVAEYLRVEKKIVKSLEDAWELAAEGGVYVRSTQSVLTTDDYRLARTIYNVASAYGTANLYAAKRIL